MTDGVFTAEGGQCQKKIAVISCINDAVLNLLDRDIVRQGIERLNGFFLLQEGLELRHAALLQIN